MMKHKQSSGDRKAEERITIVSGLPRYGTSMMMQILDGIRGQLMFLRIGMNRESLLSSVLRIGKLMSGWMASF